ncbi:hypothetical protein AB0O32_37880 [Streptomyces rubiginosohelvolus]|uniref:hypothetical protein n=1 Tax=Streptomyces rubiginosohelvolus TaxID=67362 RepID=UPI00342A2F77
MSEDVDRGGERQRRLAALLGNTEPRPVAMYQVVGRNKSVPDDEGSTGDQRITCAGPYAVVCSPSSSTSLSRFTPRPADRTALIERL